MVDGIGSAITQRRQLYAGTLSKLRMLMICRMAKPEEVLIVEDENGNIVRETMKDLDILVQYKVLSTFCFSLSYMVSVETYLIYEKFLATPLFFLFVYSCDAIQIVDHEGNTYILGTSGP
jgi:CRM1 / Exportin repeat 2